MRFEDYLDRELYLSTCKDNANRRNREIRQLTREQRRQKSRHTMLIITAVLFAVIFLVITIGFCSANGSEEQPMETYAEASEMPKLEEKQSVTIDDSIYEDFENEKIQEALIAKANRIDNVKVTYYCTEQYEHICNAGPPYKTATGSNVVPNFTCAVDPNVIPLGSTVFVDYGDGTIYEYFADDTGGAIKGNRIDIAVDTHNGALECGVKTATVYWIKE